MRLILLVILSVLLSSQALGEERIRRKRERHLSLVKDASPNIQDSALEADIERFLNSYFDMADAGSFSYSMSFSMPTESEYSPPAPKEDMNQTSPSSKTEFSSAKRATYFALFGLTTTLIASGIYVLVKRRKHPHRRVIQGDSDVVIRRNDIV